MPSATFRIWRGVGAEGGFQDYRTDVSEGMVVLDAVHRIQAEQRAGSRVPVELQGRQVRLLLRGDQRQAAADVHDTAQPAEAGRARHRRADARVSADSRPGLRRLVELPREDGHQAVRAADAGRARRHLADGAARHRSRPGVPEVHRVLPLPGRLSRHPRPPADERVHRPALPDVRGGTRDASARHRRPDPGPAARARDRLLQHHEVLHESVSGRDQDHGQRDHPVEGTHRGSLLRSGDSPAADVSGKR